MRCVILKREKRILSYFKFRVFRNVKLCTVKTTILCVINNNVSMLDWKKKERRENIYSIHIHTYTHTHVHIRTITMILINVNGFSLLYYRCYLIIYLQIIKRESVVVLFTNLDCPSKIFFSNLLFIFLFLILSFVFILYGMIWELGMRIGYSTKNTLWNRNEIFFH